MAEFPYLPFWTDAYLGDTTHLTTIEHGAFLLLLMTAWRAKTNDLPDDDKMLCRYTKLSMRQWLRIRPILEPLFCIENARWSNKRLLDELDVVRRQYRQRSGAGKASALKRLHRGSTTVQRANQRLVSTHTHTHNQTLSKKVRAQERAGEQEEKVTPINELSKIIDNEHAQAVIDHRSKLRKPLTAHAAKLLAGKFAKLTNPNDGADAMIANGWQGFEPDWLLNRNGPRFNGPAQKRTLMDAARDWIAEGDDGKNSQDGPRGHDKLISAKDAKS